MSDSFDDYRRLTAGDEAFVLPDWSIIEISGEDWREWLQGQITGDVRQLTPTHSIGFCMTKPTGQILSFGELFERDGKGWLTVPNATVSAILLRVESAVILEDCEGRTLDLPVSWSSQGMEPGLQCKPMNLLAWRLFWLEKNKPNWIFDIREKTLPPELGDEFAAKHINYNKGCYTGQEVLQRIHSRGHTNKTWIVEKSESEEIQRAGFEQTNQALHPDGYWLVAGYQRNQTLTETE